ncbi:hypothetical protein G7046_g1751 [Stylonectria norvegica]|nr:hypothetical protein G7046_g1751 [Stylonectria norvegica]
MASSKMSPLMTLLGALFFFSANVFAASAVLGVDLGTEYIKAALVKPGIPLEIVLTKDSRRKETSAVTFKPSKGTPKAGEYPERLFGADATVLAPRFPGDVYPNLKAILGLPLDHSIVQEYAARHPALQIQPHPSRRTAAFKSQAFTAKEEAWMVEELLAMELQSIQKNAELTAGDGSIIRSIVMTVPPFYTIDEKRALQTAAELAGLKVLGLLSDGLAVGLNYATSRQFPSITEGAKPEYNLIFDMGAGSTKATIMKFQSRTVKDVGKFNRTFQEAQVLGAGWDRTLGGDALNNLILDDMVSQFVESKGAQKISATSEGVRAHPRAMAKLSNQVGKLRHVLSANQNSQASFEGLYEDVDFKYKISRTEFESLAEAHAERVGVVINDALRMSGLDIADIDSIILHGGAPRTPFVQKALEKFVGSADKIRSNVNSDEAAVFGAAFRAAELSPSFRVKEIRISEGAMYPAGLRWTTSKDKTQRQRLWTALSAQGGDAKEVTFTDSADFDITFYQQIGAEDKDVKALSTKNLTATFAAIKEKFPSCVESDIQFKLAVQLRKDNGEVEIVKAAVECEAEVSDKGFVDGVKNLFGFGKKDQKPLKDGETEDTEGSEELFKEEIVEEASSSSTESTESSATTETEAETPTAEASDEAKVDMKRRETVSIPVEVTIKNVGIPELSKSELSNSKDRLKAFAASDKARLQREEALNQLEGYTYRVRDLLEGESFIEKSTEKERAKLAKLSSATSEWLYDDGADATKDQLKAKYKELQNLVLPIQKRVDEAAERPALVSDLKTALEKTTEYVAMIRKQIDEYDAWHASSSTSASASGSSESSSTTEASSETSTDNFDGLEDDASTTTARKMEDVVEEKGPVPPVFKLEDLDEVESIHKSTLEWLTKLEAKQSALGVTDNPVLLVKDLKSKREKLDKAGIDLAMKGAKSVEDKTKKAKKIAAEKKKKKGKKADADPSDKGFNWGDDNFIKFEGKDGGAPTDAEIEELLKKLKPEDMDKIKEDVEKKQQEQKESPHDEL